MLGRGEAEKGESGRGQGGLVGTIPCCRVALLALTHAPHH